MADVLKPLGVAALVAIASPVLAQEAGKPAGGAQPEAAPAEAPAAEAAPAEAPAAPAENAPAEAARAKAETYIDGVFTDWSRECVRLPGNDGADPCWIIQTLKDDNGRPFGKISVRRLPPGGQAVAQADVGVALELTPFLPAGISLGVDKGLAKEYTYLFCTGLTGCLAQPNLSAQDIEAFKAGDVLNMGFAIVRQPTELAQIKSPISLKGFTAAWESVSAPVAQQAPQ